MKTKQRMKRVYVAGPYNGPDVLSVLENIRRGIGASLEILKMGYAPFCPWLDFQYALIQGGETPGLTLKEFKCFSMAWLEAADAVYVHQYSKNSEGTHEEILRAQELGIPVVYSTTVLTKLFQGE